MANIFSRKIQLCKMDGIIEKLKTVWSNITIEPLSFLTYIVIFLSYPVTQELYLQKACQVRQGCKHDQPKYKVLCRST